MQVEEEHASLADMALQRSSAEEAARATAEDAAAAKQRAAAAEAATRARDREVRDRLWLVVTRKSVCQQAGDGDISDHFLVPHDLLWSLPCFRSRLAVRCSEDRSC